MNQLRRILGSNLLQNAPLRRHVMRPLTAGVRCYSDDPSDIDHPESPELIPVPPYKARENETLEVKKARLIYQSRKRGIAENCLLLSTFASRFLSGMSEDQVNEYDRLINEPTNDWDIFNWIIKKDPVPAEYNTEIMRQLQEHAQNKEMEERFIQPPLY